MKMKMKTNMIRRVGSGMLAAALIALSGVTPGAVTHAASVPRDVKGHWAQSYIEKAVAAGIVSGYENGDFRPDNPVTRAEFSHMVNQALGNTSTATLTFNDVNRNDWHYSDVSRAVAAGYVSGYANNTFGPDLRITRQEAAVMLSFVVPVSGNSTSLSRYPDYQSVESWARPALSYIVGKGYIGTYKDGRLHPMDSMDRAQAATVIVKILEQERIIKTDPDVTKSGTKLSNAIYSNGVTISKNVGSGEASLSNCVVLGTLDVQGGGTSTVTLTDCRVARAVVQKASGSVRVLTKGTTSVKTLSAANTAALETSSLSGEAPYGSGCKVHVTSGKIDALNVTSSAKDAEITVDSGATVALANVSAQSSFRGTGTVTRMNVGANNITYEKKPGSVTVGSSVTQAPALVDAALSITADPKNGASGVASNKKITLTFSSAIDLYGGKSIRSTDIEDIVQLRRNSSSGTRVPFSGSINTVKKVITLVPEDSLATDTRFYISIAKNKIEDKDGNGNSAFSSIFTTGDEYDDYVSYTPKNGATGVSVSGNLTVRFSEKMTNYDESTIKDSHIVNIITLRKTNSSGTKVPYTAAIDSAKKVITIKPNSNLDAGTKYYLSVNSKSLRTADRGTAVPASSVIFTAGDDYDDYVSYTPKNGATGVSVSGNLTVRFSEKMINYDESTIKDSHIGDIITLRKTNSSGTKIPYTAVIDSAKKVITIKPNSNLEAGTRYYLSVNSKSLRTSDRGTAVPASSVIFTTATVTTVPTAALTVSSNEDTITVSASGNLAGTIYAVLLPSGAVKPSAAQVISGKDAGGSPALSRISSGVSANSAKEIGKFKDLAPNTTYKVCIVLDPADGAYANSAVVEKTIATSPAPVPDSVLSTLSVDCGGKNYPISLKAGVTDYSLDVPFDSEKVTISASTDGGNTWITKDSGGSGATSETVTETIPLKGAETSVRIISSRSGAKNTEYTLTIKVKVEGNTDLKSVVVGENVLKPSGTSYAYEIPADTESVDIVITSTDTEATIETESLGQGQGTLTLQGISQPQDIEVTVTSYDKTKSYEIVITKASQPEGPGDDL